MDYQEIEKKLWTEFLNRIDIEKNASPNSTIRFMFDRGSFEGVDVTQFQMKAVSRLHEMGAITKYQGLYSLSDSMLKLKEALGEVRPLATGYTIDFNTTDKLFDSAVLRLRTSLRGGGINIEPIFELILIKRDVVIRDFEASCEWHIHKMNLDSPAHQVLECMLREGKLDIRRAYLDEKKIKAKHLGDLVGEMKFVGNLKQIFFDATRDRLVLHPIVTAEDLIKLNLTATDVRKQLKAIDRLR